MRSDVDGIVRGAVAEALASRDSVRPTGSITLKAAQAVIRAVLDAAERMHVKVIAAVCDAGGNPVAVSRMDDAFIASYDIALGKAYTSVALKMPTEELSRLAAPGGELYGIQHTNGGKIVIFGGGEPLRRKGEIVGGLGVSGGTLVQDTELGRVGKQYWEDILCR